MWSSVKSRLDHLKWFQWYIDQVGCSGPQLVGSPDQLRTWLRWFVESLNSHITMTGPNKGGRLTDRPSDDMALEDEVISKIAAGSGVLAAPKSGGGLDDRQAFQVLMLLIRTGRRMNEVPVMDFKPLLPLLTTSKQQDKEPDGFVARLAHQQTKITGGDPPTIPVDVVRARGVRRRADLRHPGGSAHRCPCSHGHGLIPLRCLDHPPPSWALSSWISSVIFSRRRKYANASGKAHG